MRGFELDSSACADCDCGRHTAYGVSGSQTGPVHAAVVPHAGEATEYGADQAHGQHAHRHQDSGGGQGAFVDRKAGKLFIRASTSNRAPARTRDRR